MPYLFDTNIFLEILLNQDKKEKAKKFLNDNIGELFVSDFSLHSIGIILIKQQKFNTFKEFLTDIIPLATVISLPKDSYFNLSEISEKYHLDFDDSYQTFLAKEFELGIVTMDHDFKKVTKYIKVKFL